MPSVTKPRSAEMEAGPGFRVKASFPRTEAKLVRAFSSFRTPDVSDRMNRLYTADAGIRVLTPRAPALRGPACTVRVFPGDNLMVHKALDVAAPRDVIVVDAGGSTMNAVLGDIVSTKARHRGIAGFVVDGLVRDLPGIRRLGFPVFARGVTPIGPLHRGPGEINHPIQCGGIVVHPGDIVAGDLNGVVVIPREIAAELLVRLEAQKRALASYVAAVARGSFSNEWVDNVLREAGCELSAVDAALRAAPSSGSRGA